MVQNNVLTVVAPKRFSFYICMQVALSLEEKVVPKEL